MYSHSTFVPELDLNPPTSWSKPASALGLSNPVNHLPQSQQIQRLQQQIQHHRQLQRSTQAPIKIRRTHSSSGSSNGSNTSKNQQRAGTSVSPTTSTAASPSNPTIDPSEMFGYNTTQGQGVGSGDRAVAAARNNNNNSNNNPHYRHSFQFGSNGHVQHINIRNTYEDDDEDQNDNDDSSMSGTENEDINNRGMDIKMKMSNSGSAFQHHRSMSHPDFSRGFNTALHGFTPITTESSHSPPSPPTGSYTSEGNGFSAAVMSPGMMTQSSHNGGLQYDGGSSFQGTALSRNSSMGGGGVESSLASLADLSVMSSMPGLARKPSTDSSGSNSSTFPFQPQQGLPVIYQNQATFNPFASSRGPSSQFGFNDNNSISGLTSALGQQLQRQQMLQEQQQNQYHAFPTTGPTLSASLPAISGFQPYCQQMAQKQQQQQQQQQEEQTQQQNEDDDAQDDDDDRRSRSKSLTLIPPPRRELPPRAPQTSAPRKYLGRQARKVPIVNEVKEVTTPTRRMAHILSEQKRREKINGGFDELKSVIPECAENTDSKATILRKAVDYICLLEDELRRYAEIFERDGHTKDEFDD